MSQRVQIIATIITILVGISTLTGWNPLMSLVKPEPTSGPSTPSPSPSAYIPAPDPRPAPIDRPDPTRKAFERVSIGDCIGAYMDPYDAGEWSEALPGVVDCDRTDAYMRVIGVEEGSTGCRSKAQDAETWWRYSGEGDSIYLCLERQLRSGECFLGLKDDDDGNSIAINGHGLMTSWQCDEDTVPKIFDYILQVVALTNGQCPANSYSWRFRGGKLCARVA